MRPAVLVALVTLLTVVTPSGGCLRDHDPDAVQTSAANRCLTCHLHDFQGTTMPVHEGVFPRTCDFCHRDTGWQPALEGLHPPTARFPIDRGDHEGIACLDCHDPDRGPSAAGANTTCAGCHTHRRDAVDGEHDEVGDYAWSDTDPAFCLRCHADGRED